MVTVPEAARRVGRNPETIRRWIRERKLVASKVGNQHVIDEEDLTRFVAGGGFDGRAAHRAQSYPVVSELHRARSGRSASLAESGLANAPSPPALGTDEWLPAIVGRIVRLVDPVRIVLFGSRATGHAHHDSDYDLLVVVDELPDRRAMAIEIRRSLGDLPIAKDVVVAERGEVEGTAARAHGVLYWALHEGRTIYERQ